MFIELMPLLGERTVMLTVARIDQNRIRVNVIPIRKREDENAALGAPLSFIGGGEGRDGRRRRPHVSGPAGKQGGQQTDSTGTEAPAYQENPPLLPACRLSGGYCAWVSHMWGYFG